MAVNAGVKFFFRIVEVKSREQVDADDLIEFAEGLFVTIFAAEIVPGGKSMFGVEADAQSVALVGRIDHVGDLFEAIAELRALPRGDLQGNSGFVTGTSFVNLIEGFGDRLDSLRFARSHMRAGMGDEIAHAENFAALQFVDKRFDGSLSQGVIGRAEIKQVGIMGDDGADVSFVAIDLE